MARKGGAPENLKKFTPGEMAKKAGHNGGIKSGEARRERNRISDIYAKFLASEFDIMIDDIEKTITGEKLVEETIRRIMAKADSASVAIMKEIREATEGSKVELSGELKCIKVEIVDKATDATV